VSDFVYSPYHSPGSIYFLNWGMNVSLKLDKSVYPDYDTKSYNEKMKRVEDVYLKDLQLKYWKDQYGEFKEGN
jgi:hypothetical protein